MLRRTALSLALVCFAMVANAEEWTRFRGPNGTGISPVKGLPVSWEEDDYAWKVELPGVGHSQPVIWGEKVFVASATRDGAKRVLSCHAAATGKELWRKDYDAAGYHTHEYNNLAPSTPALDAERVYVAFATPEEIFLAALDHDGKELWNVAVGAYSGMHGFGASPMVHGELVIFPVENSTRGDPDAKSFIVAYERATGKVAWKTPRLTTRVAYGTPCYFEDAQGRAQLLFTSQSHGIYALDPATGEQIFEARVFDKRPCASPVIADGLIIGSCGSGGGGNYAVAIRAGGEGDVTKTHVAYEVRQSAPYVPTALAKDGKVWLWSDKGGIVTCLRAATGEEIYRARANGNYFGSPVWADGRIYCIANEGEVVVIDGGEEFKLLARNPLGERSHSTPAIAGGRMFLRTESHLMALAGEKVASTASEATK